MKSGGTYAYTYADLADMQEAIRGPLAQNGLSIAQPYIDQDGWIQLVTILMHSSGQWIKSVLKFTTNGLKIQEIGSAMTYNRRYAQAAILNLCADEDDDGALANEVPRPKNKKEYEPAKESIEPAPASMPESDLISSEEATELEMLVHFYPVINKKIDPRDFQYRDDLIKYFSNVSKTNIANFFALPKKYYDAAMRSAKKRIETLKNQESKNEEEIPF